ALTITAFSFLYYLMLPVMLRFFIIFGSLVVQTHPATAPLPPEIVLPTVPVLTADPVTPEAGAMWVNETLRELRIAVGVGDETPQVFRLPMDVGGTIAQEYRIGEYVNLVFGLAIVFAIAFQLPIVMLLLSWVGILEAKDLKPWRR